MSYKLQAHPYDVRWPVRFAALAVLAGCSASPLPVDSPDAAAPVTPPLYSSGARLRARVMDAGGDAVAFWGWYDKQLDINCSFRLSDDGNYHCLPETKASFVTLFADAECTQPALYAQTDPCGTQAPHVSSFVDGQLFCGGAQSMKRGWRISRTRAAAAYSKVGAQCQPVTDTTIVDITQEPATDFVQAHITQEDVGSGLTLGILNGADGSRQSVFRNAEPLVDTAHNSACTPMWVGDFGNHNIDCVPWSASSYGFTYADPTCSAKPVVVFDSRCPAPTIVQFYDGSLDAGNGGTRLHTVGAPVIEPLYSGSVGACSPQPTAGLTIYPAGPEITDRDLPRLHLVAVGSGPLVALDVRTDSARTLQQG